MAITQQIRVEQWKHLLRKKCFLMSHGDDKAKLLGYSGYKMKAMFQLWDNISSVISWHNYLDINKTHDWTLNSLIGIHREQKLQEVCEVSTCSYLRIWGSTAVWINLKGNRPKLLFLHLFSMAGWSSLRIVQVMSHVTHGFLNLTGSSFQCVISTLLLGIHPGADM